MWNLLSIVREMFKRNDRNAIPLLEIITEECMACEQILVWWFNTKVALLNGTGYGSKHNMNSNVHASQHACSSLCDEIVVLWRLAALNPGLSPSEREMLHAQFMAWHLKIIDKVSILLFSFFRLFDKFNEFNYVFRSPSAVAVLCHIVHTIEVTVHRRIP